MNFLRWNFQPSSMGIVCQDATSAEFQGFYERVSGLTDANHSFPMLCGWEISQVPEGRLRAVSDEDALSLSYLRHEIDHVQLNLLTTYGLLRRIMTGRLAVNVAETWKVRSATNHPCPFPVRNGDLLKRVLEAERSFRKVFLSLEPEWNSPEIHAIATEDALKTIDGDAVLSSGCALRGLIENQVSYMNGVQPRFLKKAECDFAPFPKKAGLRAHRSSNEFCPQVRGTMLGAKHLFEAHAILEQLNVAGWLGRTPLIMPHIERALLGQGTYANALSYWVDVIGSVAPGRRDRGTIDYPIELSFAIELALTIPLGPFGYASTSKNLIDYEDIHPGWRFIQIVQLLSESPEIFSKNDDEPFTVFCDRVCRRLGWPTPKQLYTEWVPHFEYISTSRAFNETFMEVGCDSIYLSDVNFVAHFFADKPMEGPPVPLQGFGWIAAKDGILAFLRGNYTQEQMYRRMYSSAGVLETGRILASAENVDAIGSYCTNYGANLGMFCYMANKVHQVDVERLASDVGDYLVQRGFGRIVQADPSSLRRTKHEPAH